MRLLYKQAARELLVADIDKCLQQPVVLNVHYAPLHLAEKVKGQFDNRNYSSLVGFFVIQLFGS